jgi:UDP-glucose 4-epimerase
MPPARFIVTGSTGFVGARVLAGLAQPAAALRLGGEDWKHEIEMARFEGAVVLHLAGRAHQGGSEEQYRHDNVEKTRALAQAAARGGAVRLVFLSSIKVNGESTRGRAFTRDDAPAPEDAYGRSKRDAEAQLARMRASGELQSVVVRSPLVIGARAKGNLASLLRLADTGWPLPLASIHNRRSFVHVDDLAQLLIVCAREPQAVGKIYLAAHADPFSTPGLAALMREALGRPRRLVAFAPSALEIAGSLSGRGDAIRRLTRSLEVDASAAQRELGWRAQASLAQAVDEMTRHHRART